MTKYCIHIKQYVELLALQYSYNKSSMENKLLENHRINFSIPQREWSKNCNCVLRWFIWNINIFRHTTAFEFNNFPISIVFCNKQGCKGSLSFKGFTKNMQYNEKSYRFFSYLLWPVNLWPLFIGDYRQFLQCIKRSSGATAVPNRKDICHILSSVELEFYKEYNCVCFL
jgi:hypothetical protein